MIDIESYHGNFHGHPQLVVNTDTPRERCKPESKCMGMSCCFGRCIDSQEGMVRKNI